MRRLAIPLLLAAATFAQQPKAAPAPTPTPASAVPTTIPKDATRLEPDLYRWVDPQGKPWLLRRTPFGIIRTPEDVDAQYRKLVPKDARRTGPNTFEWTDPEGKAWIYEITPLGGVSKALKSEVEKNDIADTLPTDWTVEEDGDSVKFSRPWPFGGATRWSRKKDELTDTERGVWQRELKKKQEKKNDKKEDKKDEK